MARLPEEQAKLVGRIRDALRVLNFVVPAGDPGTPGTLADLVYMAPAMGQFAHKMGPTFVKAVREEADPIHRAALFAKYAESVSRRHKPNSSIPLSEVFTALGKGFLAYHSSKSPTGRISAVLNTLSNINAAPSR